MVDEKKFIERWSGRKGYVDVKKIQSIKGLGLYTAMDESGDEHRIIINPKLGTLQDILYAKAEEGRIVIVK